jgi:hypothetical protein
MHQRRVITLIGGAAVAWPLKALAQSDRSRRIGVLLGYPEGDPQAQATTRRASVRQRIGCSRTFHKATPCS